MRFDEERHQPLWMERSDVYWETDLGLTERDLAEPFADFAPVRRDSHGADRSVAPTGPALGGAPSSAPEPTLLRHAFYFTATEARLAAAAIYCAIGLMHEQGFSTAELEELRNRLLGGTSEHQPEAG